MANIDIDERPIALIVQIDPSNNKVMEVVLKTEFAIPGHTGVRDVWHKDMDASTRAHVQVIVDRCIGDLIAN